MLTRIHYIKIGQSIRPYEFKMVLDLEFHKLLERELRKSIDFTFKQNMDFKEIWNCTNADDFLYGWHMGRSDDFCRNQFFLHYHKAPDKKEVKEIQDILFNHAKEFRDQLTKE